MKNVPRGITVVPIEERIPRPACPLYGLRLSGSILLEQGMGRCAIASSNPVSCLMESRQEKPNWEGCSRVTEKLAEAKEIVAERAVKGDKRFPMPEDKNDLFLMLPNMLGISFVFPSEFRPEGLDGWEGLTLEEWFIYITSPYCPR